MSVTGLFMQCIFLEGAWFSYISLLMRPHGCKCTGERAQWGLCAGTRVLSVNSLPHGRPRRGRPRLHLAQARRGCPAHGAPTTPGMTSIKGKSIDGEVAAVICVRTL